MEKTENKWDKYTNVIVTLMHQTFFNNFYAF